MISVRFARKNQWLNRFAHLFFIFVISCAALLSSSTNVYAHQPFFEDVDTTSSTPISIANPTISTALYATLDRVGDVDYFVFDGNAGDRVGIGVTIPQIDGQEDFAPHIALVGPGLPSQDKMLLPDLPSQQLLSDGLGLYHLQPTAATTFYEPFSRTSYWRRQREQIVLPAAARYTVVVWSEEKQIGRYVLVVGDREVMGGDPLFALKISSYWTPLDSSAAASDATPPPVSQPSCHWLLRLLARFYDQVPGC